MPTHPNLTIPRICVAMSVCLASTMIVDTARAEFWFEEFTDGNTSDAGIEEWTYARGHNRDYSISTDGLLAIAGKECCGAGAGPDWPTGREGWSIRTQGRLLQEHGLIGAGTSPRPDHVDTTWNLVTASGYAVLGSGVRDGDPISEPIETDLRPFEEDVVIQLDTLDGMMRMWAWREGEQPAQDIEPLIEEDFDLPNGFPIFWTRSDDGPSSAQYRWFAISTEHMPVDMLVPLSDLIGDFSGNEILDVADIDRLGSEIQSGSVDLPYDLNQDGTVDREDHTYWVTQIKQTWIGDANLDGEFNSGDFVEAFQAGKYASDEAATWSQGDWNADGVFDSSDFVTAFQGGGYEMGQRASVAAVPEPSAAILLMFGLVGIARARRHRISN